MLVPDCASIYPEFLPQGRHIELPSAAEILAERLVRSGVEVVCASAALRAVKNEFEVFLRHDTHWSTFGAYRCYLELMQVVGRYLPIPPLSAHDIRYGVRIGFGDLGIHLRPERRGPIPTVDFPDHPVRILANINDQHVKSFRLASSMRGSGRLLIFRDSAANALLPYLDRTFAETIAVAPSPQVLDDAIDHFRPDLVIMEVAESGLYLPEFAFTDWDPRTFEQLYLEPNGAGRARELYNEALEYVMTSRQSDAIAAAATMAVLDDDKTHINILAWALLNAHQYNYCRAIATRFANGRSDRFLHYLHSQAAFSLGDFPEATAALSHALAIQPSNAQYLYSDGEMNYQKGRYREALASLCSSVEYAPLYERSWVLTITSLLRLGEIAEAASHQKRADEIFGRGRIVPEQSEQGAA